MPAPTLLVIAQVTIETTGTMLLGTRDRRGADRAGAAGHRPDRPQLRHRPGRDERAPALPGRALPGSACPACPTRACRVLTADGARYPLTARRNWPTRTTGSPASTGSRWSAAAAAPRRSTSPRSSSGCAGRRRRPAPPAPGAGRLLAVPATCRSARTPRSWRSASGPTPTGPRRSATRCSPGPLGGLRGDRPRPDPRRRAPARPVRGLRGPGRRRGHEGGRRPARHGRHAADRARLHRAGRDRGGPGAARRPRGDQLGQLRGRRRARLPDGPDHARRQGARRGGRRADHRRERAGAHRRAGRSRSPPG